MKRLFAIIFTLAIVIGAFAPVTATLSFEGASFGVQTVSAQADVSGETDTDPSAVLAADPANNLGDCGFTTPMGCIAWITYYIPYSVGQWFMGVAARTFDVSASFTLSSQLYTSGSFLQEGWQITRDFANIFFILILLFIAVSLVLDLEIGHANPKKMLASLVMVAVVINFSFFITEVIIDTSNSLALVFYNQVTVVTSNGVELTDKNLNDQLKQAQGTDANKQQVQYIQGEKPISVALVRAMQPQVLSSQEFYNKLCRSADQGFYTSLDTGEGEATRCDSNKMSGVLIALFILVGIMYIVVGYAFFVALGSLIGRMIGLFINIVFAPIAFVSLIIPSMNHNFGDLGWDGWLKNLLTNAFAAPIFFFFILLISILSKSTIIPKETINLSPGVILLLVTIQFLILITMLLRATKYVKTASGEIGAALGGIAGGLVKGLGGLALGTAAGAVAVGAQSTIGRGAQLLAKNDSLNKWTANGNGVQRFIGKQIIKTADAGSKASFNASAGLAAVTGLNVNSLAQFSQERTAGGYEGAIAYRAKKTTEFSEMLRKNQKEEDSLKHELDARKALAETEEDKVDQAKVNLKNFEDSIKGVEKIVAEAEKELDRTLKNKFSTEAEIDLAKDNVRLAKAALDAKKTPTGIDPATNKPYPTMSSLTKTLKDAESALRIAQRGERNADGSYKKVTDEDIDPTKNPNGYTMANGRKAKKTDVGVVVKTESLSIKDLEELIETNKKANAKAYLYNEAKDSGHHITPKFDKLGNVKSFHIDSNAPGHDNMWGPLAIRSLTKMSYGGAFGAALGYAVAGPIGAAVGAQNGVLAGSLAQIVQELDNVRTGNTIGSSYTAAEAAHHTAEPHGDHGHGDHGHGHGHGHGGGVISSLISNIISPLKALGSGGGGGGGHGGGHGGDHGGGHH